ncbi:MarR family transcriptional regulator [Gordonia sp. LSe1-13]|uniref:MarR family transcriptional regulator n=1 Tax=Gordonia sesuvii TaxID=3116777 RepID=A0ABU7MJW6_9ACTN|nr:MarR family transcriptional regulator [Gordonia sp. LSe1-13]
MTDVPPAVEQVQQLLSDSALTTFRLNGQFLALAENLARPAGLTATRWQVLGAVINAPLTVSDIARAMGITRQSVQRTADLLAADGLVEYRDNPGHRRAKLVRLTDEGLAAIRRINPGHRIAATTLAERVGVERLAEAVATLHALSAALDDPIDL